jgi:GDSL-like Lipase/Acylhydrolase family
MSPRGAGLLRAAVALIGGLLIAYAVSDHYFYGGEPGIGKLQWVMVAVGALIVASSATPLSWVQGVLLASLATAATIGLLEVVAEKVLAPSQRPIYQADGKLIFKLISDRTSAMTRLPINGGETVVHRINRAGFRGPEIGPKGAAPRVVVYGDSFIHATYSTEEETFARQLERALAGRLGRPVEVVNAGVSSYGPDQILLRLDEELPALKPDLIIVSIFAGNDYGDLLRNKLFRLDADGRLEANPWALDPQVKTRFDLAQRESILLRAARRIAGGRHAQAAPSAAGGDEGAALLEEAEREYRSAVVDRDPLVTNTHIDYFSADVSLRPSAPSSSYKVRLMGALMQALRDKARAHQVPLVFMFIPHPIDVVAGYDSPAIDRSRYPDYRPRNLVAPLEGAATSLGVSAVSLFDVLSSPADEGLFFRGGDDHWTAKGQQRAAQAVAQRLVDERWLPSR